VLSYQVHRAPVARAAAALFIALPLALAACGGSSTPAPSPAAAQALAKTIPTTVGDVTLTVVSGDLTDLADDVPNYDQLVERVRNADLEPADVLAAVGKPASGGTDPTVSGLEVQDAPPGGLGLLGMMQAWTSSIDGATTTGMNLGGKPVTQVTFSDGTPPLYYYLFDTNKADQESSDTMYYVRTADQTMAEDALSQLP
jgi:hypothetical protein